MSSVGTLKRNAYDSYEGYDPRKRARVYAPVHTSLSQPAAVGFVSPNHVSIPTVGSAGQTQGLCVTTYPVHTVAPGAYLSTQECRPLAISAEPRPEAVTWYSAPQAIPSVSVTDFNLNMSDTRRLGNFVVDFCLSRGKLPVFGVEAEELLKELSEADIKDASSRGQANEEEIKRWIRVVTQCDTTQLCVEQRKRKGGSRQVPLRSLMNVKISEHWSYKAKILFKRLNTMHNSSSLITTSDLTSASLIRGIASWTGVKVPEVQPEHVVITVWRINKRLSGRSLRDDVQDSRVHVRGKRVDVSEFELARDVWRDELVALYKTLFPVLPCEELEKGKVAASKSTRSTKKSKASLASVKPAPKAEPIPVTKAQAPKMEIPEYRAPVEAPLAFTNLHLEPVDLGVDSCDSFAPLASSEEGKGFSAWTDTDFLDISSASPSDTPLDEYQPWSSLDARGNDEPNFDEFDMYSGLLPELPSIF